MKKTGIPFLIILCIILFAQEARNQNSLEWEALGPLSRNVKGMAFNPMNPQEIYALMGDSSGCVYKSDYCGQYWYLKATLNSICYDISVNPQYPSIIYILGKNGLFKSEDSGSTWQEYRFGDNSYGIRGVLSVDPNNVYNVYATGSHYYSSGRSCMAFFSSNDGGENWATETLSSGSKRGYTTCLSINPTDSNVIYCGGYYYDDALNYYYKIFKSTDGGVNWSDITGSIDGFPKTIVIDATDPSKVYVGTTEGIFRSTNGGFSWQKNNGDACANALSIDPLDSDTIYAGDCNCCYKSIDGGANWTAYSEGQLKGLCDTILVSSIPYLVFYGSNAGIFKSDDSGYSWTQSDSGLLSSQIMAFSVSQSSPNVIYLKAAGSGLLKSCDFGTNWNVLLPDEGWCSSMIQVKVNPNNENDIFIYPGPAG